MYALFKFYGERVGQSMKSFHRNLKLNSSYIVNESNLAWTQYRDAIYCIWEKIILDSEKELTSLNSFPALLGLI